MGHACMRATGKFEHKFVECATRIHAYYVRILRVVFRKMCGAHV